MVQIQNGDLRSGNPSRNRLLRYRHPATRSFCRAGHFERQLDPAQQAALKALSRQVLAQMEFRRNLILLREALIDRTKEEHERQQELLKLQQTLLRVLGLRASKP